MIIYKSLVGETPPTPPINIHSILFQRPDLADIPSYVVHIDAITQENRTRAQFLTTVKEGANAFAASTSDGGLALGPDDMVGIFSDNTLDYAVLVHALLKIGVPFALMSSYSTASELEHLLRKSHATRLFVHPSLLPLALQVAGKVGLAQDRVFTVGGIQDPKQTSIISLRGLIARTKNAPDVAVKAVTKDTLAYLVFSSGTTGPPKPAMITHGNLVAMMLQGMAFNATSGPPPDYFPVILNFLPWYHSYGFIACLVRMLAVPTTIVVLPRWNIDLFIESIPRYKITSLPLIPSIMPQLLESEKFRKADLSSLRLASFGAAHTPPAIYGKLQHQLGKKIDTVEGYGLSETTLAVLTTPGPALIEKKGLKWNPAAKGILNPGLQVRLVRDDGKDAKIGEPGEMYVKGDTIFPGYYKDQRATRNAFSKDGWFKTGDTFTVDENGNFYFQDRSKDTMKVSGVQVSPSEIEQVILAHPESVISDVCVAGVLSKRGGDDRVPRAWVVLSEVGKQRGVKQVVTELDRWTKEQLSKYKWLRGGIEVVDEIPKLSTGKVLRRELVDRYNASATGSKL